MRSKKKDNFNEKVKLAKQRGSIHNQTMAAVNTQVRQHKRVTTPSDWQNIEMSEVPPPERTNISASKAFAAEDEEEDVPLRSQVRHTEEEKGCREVLTGSFSTKPAAVESKEIQPLHTSAVRHNKQNNLVMHGLLE